MAWQPDDEPPEPRCPRLPGPCGCRECWICVITGDAPPLVYAKPEAEPQEKKPITLFDGAEA